MKKPVLSGDLERYTRDWTLEAFDTPEAAGDFLHKMEQEETTADNAYQAARPADDPWRDPNWQPRPMPEYPTAFVQELRQHLQSGDVIIYYRSDRRSWECLAGREGWWILRGDTIVFGILTRES